MAPNDRTRTTEPPAAAVQQAAPVPQQQQPETVGTTPAQTVNAAPAHEGLIARFERITGTGATLPFARCSVLLDGALKGIELHGFTIWKDAKSGDFTLKMPGQRSFQDLRPAMVEATTRSGQTTIAADPDGVALLQGLDTGIYAAFHVWNKHGGDRFPGGKVPVTLT